MWQSHIILAPWWTEECGNQRDTWDWYEGPDAAVKTCLQNMGGILIENGAEQHYKSVVLTPGSEAVLMLISFKIIFKKIN